MADNGTMPPRRFLTRITWAFFGSLSIFALTSFLSYHLERQLLIKIDRMMQTSMAWAQLAEDTEKLREMLEKSLVAGDNNSYNNYALLAREFHDRAWSLVCDPILNRDVMAGEGVRGMIETMLSQAQAILENQKRRSFAQSADSLREFTLTGELLKARIHQAVMDLLRRESGNYRIISERLAVVGRVALLFMAGGLSLALLMLWVISYRLTRPLVELTEAVHRVSQGDFSRPVPVRDRDEIGYVAEAFNQMARNVAGLIRDLQEKSVLEVKLKEREVENLATQNMLQEARLQALQGQINPHFFFNTLNAGVQLANMENAEETAAFFEKMGRLFRYSLRSTGVAVALEEELNYVENFVDLLHMRFGDEAFFYSTEIDPSLLDAPVPRLTIQPLVENAYLHGLSDLTGGHITVRVRRDGVNILIEVIDDGAGISEAAVEQVLGPYDGNGKTVRISGLANVIARLRLWTGEEHPVEIFGHPGRGTVVRLRLPAQK